MWHKPQKSAETQSFSPLLSNINQGNNDFVYVSALEKILNSPLDASKEAYAVFNNGTNVSGYFTTIGEKPYVEPKEAYVVVSSDSTTLTFYCDDQRSMRDGVEGWTHGIEEEKNGYPIWLNAEFNEFGLIQCIKPYETIIFNISFKDARPKSCRFWFDDCAKLTKIEGIEYLNTSEVTDMCSMFCNCSNLTTLDVSNFNTENVTTMWCMFDNCCKITELNVSRFNTNNVEEMGNMFRGCSSLTSLDVSKFNTENVSYIGYMFGKCSSLTTLDVSNFNTENVTNMDNMFYDCTNLKTIFVGDNWETFSVTSSGYMFLGCPNLYGGKGTAYNENFTDATYARIDGGADAPGYFTKVGEQPWAPKSIAVTTLPNKTEYYIGDELNLNGGEVTVTFPDNSTKTALLYDVEVSGFDNTKIGTQTLTVEFMGKTVTFDVTVKEDERIVRELYPNTEIRQGTNLSNCWFGFYYTNGEWDSKPLTFSGVTVSGLNIDVPGIYDVTITYKGVSWNGKIDVHKPIASFDFTNVNTTLNMNANERPTGKVTVINEDGTSYEVDINEMSLGDYKHTSGEQTISVYYRNTSAQLTVNVVDGPTPYAVFDNGTLTFYYDKNKGNYDVTYGMRAGYNDEWGTIASDITKVVFDKSFADYYPTSCVSWFSNCSMLTEIIDMEKYLNTENVTDMGWMFQGCSNLTFLDLSNFNTEKVTHLAGMFSGSGLTELDISSFDTRNVTDMNGMFYNCSALMHLDISKWNTENVTDMGHMFVGCESLKQLDVSSFKTENVTFMAYMFYGCSNLTTIDVSHFNTETVTNMAFMFFDCTNLTTIDVSNFNTKNVTDMSEMFSYCKNLKTIFVGDNWTTSAGMSSESMFNGCTSLIGGKGTIYNENFTDATYARIDGGTDAPGYFTKVGEQPYIPNRPYAVFDNGTLTFYYDNNKGNFDGAYGMKTQWGDEWSEIASDITKVVFDKSFADYRPTNCNCWFSQCSNLTEIQGMKENLNTENVTDMGGMFLGCSNLTTLDVSNFKTDNVTNMNYMFDGCSSLTTLDVSNFNTENVTSMSVMFRGCSSLQTIYVGDIWTTKNVTYSNDMFYDCYSLYGGKGTAYNENFTDATYANIDAPENGKPGYFTKSGEQPWGPISIDLTTLPNKTEYNINDDLNLEGGELTATFPDNTTKITSLSNAKVSGFDNTKIGEQTITVTWLGKETSFTVTVKEDTREVDWVGTNTAILLGTPFESIWMDVRYKNGDWERKTFSDSQVNVTGLNTDVAGVQNVTITYRGCVWNATFEVYKPIASFDFSIVNTNLNLNANEKLSGFVTVTNEDGTTYEVDVNQMSINIYHETEGYWSLYAIDDDNAYDKTLGEHEFKVVYHNHEANLKYTFYNGPAPAKPYVILADKTITFYSGETIPEGAYELQTSYLYLFNTPWAWGDYETVVFDKSFKNYKPTSTAYWFYGLFNLKEIKGLENLNTEKVTDMQSMFYDCFKLESLDLSGFDVSNVTNMEGMFWYNTSLHTIYVGDNWNLSDNLYSNNMFKDCPSLYGERGSMPVSYEVYDASYARIDGGDNAPGYFTKKGNAKATVASIDFNVKPYTEHILGEPLNRQDAILNVNFENREAQHLPYANINVTTIGYDSTNVGTQTVTVNFRGVSTSYEVSVAAKDTSFAYLDDNGVLTLYYGEYKQGVLFGSDNLFDNKNAVNKVVIDKSFVDCHPTSCANWFYGFNNMKEIEGLENINTQDVTDMSYMFTYCDMLESLDISSFNTANVTNMEGMFYSCQIMKTIYVGDNWSTDAVTNSTNMFGWCEVLVGGQGTMWNFDNANDATYARIDGGADAPGYFTYKMVVSPIDITLTSSPTKLEYIEGQELDLTGGEITITYNDETTETIDLTDANVTLSEFDNTKTGDQTIKVFLKGEEVGTFTVNVKAKSVVSIALTAPKKLEYVEGTSLDLKGGKITITYDNETTEDIPLTDENVTISEFNNSEIGEKTLTVNYNGEKVDDFTIKVVAKSVASIRVTKSPEKLTYKKGETLTIDDGEITVTYNNKTTEVLAFTAEGVTISEFYNTTLGDQNIKVTYAEKVATFKVTVVPDKEILSITISKLPKTEYFVGDDLDISGGELTITYDDQTTETVKLSIAKLSGFNSETVGKQTIKVTYLEKETTFEVNVKAVEIVSIELTTAPTKLEYIENEEFSAEGGEITVTFNNEATQKVALTDEKVSVSGFDNTKVGTQTLKVVYNEKETTFDVKVIAKSLEKIAILTQPAKVEYLEGEEFSAEGGEFVAYYNNNSSDTLELGKATVSGFDNTKIGEQVLKVVYNEKTAEIKVTVSAKPEPEPEPVVENPYTKPELKDGFYQISTAEELLWFVFDVNSGDTKANAALTQDIVFNEDCLERVLKLLGISKSDGDLTVWQPIGTSENAFAGIFDGQGHSISGLFINDKTQDNVGLFGATTSDAVIKNVAVVDSYISGGENVGAICGKSEGKIENCYSLSEVKGTENVNGIAGKVESGSTVENCYYLAETPKENDPCAKTAAEFKSGEVAELLAKGGEAWKDVKELPGVESVVVPDEPEQPENPENPETATFDIVVTDNVKIWSFEKTIYVENSANEIVIVDMTGKVVKRVTPISDRMEIQLNKGGIYIVKTGLSTKKIVIR